MKVLIFSVFGVYCAEHALDAFTKGMANHAAEEVFKLSGKAAEAAAPHIKKGFNNVNRNIDYYVKKPDPIGSMKSNAAKKVCSWLPKS